MPQIHSTFHLRMQHKFRMRTTRVMERRTLLFDAGLGLLLFICLGTVSGQNFQNTGGCVSNSRCGEHAHYCFNQARGRRTCQCHAGYQNTTPQLISYLICKDVNECFGTATICGPNTVCRNTPGSYECRCSSGFGNIQMLPISKWACSDINECTSATLNLCGQGTICENLLGSFRCNCINGYNSDGLKNGKYTCSLNSPCGSRGLSCGSGTTCQVTSGSPTCACAAGHNNLRTSQGIIQQVPAQGRASSICDDINECLNPNTCGANSRCENTVGSYSCIPDNVEVVDQYVPEINECIRPGTPICADNQKCVNTVGSYHCIPRDGGTTDVNGVFKDINECEIPNVCQETEVCVNLLRSYRCDSKPGYYNGQDINECLGGNPANQPLNPNGLPVQNPIGIQNPANPIQNPANPLQNTLLCLPSDRCVNTIGSYRCVPQDGGTRDIVTGNFIDINECEFHGVCPGNQVCQNTPGSFLCIDGPGVSQGVDIDECTAPNPPCGQNQKCVNTQGSFQCVGQAPGIGGVPQEVDECAIPKVCPTNQRCRNTPGGFECLSNAGFDTNGQDKNECLLQTNICTGLGKCINTIGDYECVPISGGEVGQDGLYRDIDECKYPGICHGTETCVNSIGSYQCQSAAGFQNGIDIDECENNGICTGINTVCRNTIGSYTCLPPNGLIGQTDMNECEIFGICGTGQTCENDHGSFRCVSASINGGGIGNEDEDECQTRLNVCPNEVCVNTVGSYRCIPLTGGYTDQSGRFVDINECNIVNALPCGTNGLCQNAIGSFSCTCQSGFISSTGDGRHCRSFGSDGRSAQGALGQSGGQLSNEASIGIGVGVAVIALAVIVIVIVAVVLRKRKRRRGGAAE